MAFSCHAPFFILLPRNPVIPGQLLLMRRGNEQRFSWGGGGGGGEGRTEIIGSLKLEKVLGALLPGKWGGDGMRRRFGIGVK